jgi:hypothetical protein
VKLGVVDHAKERRTIGYKYVDMEEVWRWVGGEYKN